MFLLVMVVVATIAVALVVAASILAAAGAAAVALINEYTNRAANIFINSMLVPLQIMTIHGRLFRHLYALERLHLDHNVFETLGEK